jgi:hypothetical protein
MKRSTSLVARWKTDHTERDRAEEHVPDLLALESPEERISPDNSRTSAETRALVESSGDREDVPHHPFSL